MINNHTQQHHAINPQACTQICYNTHSMSYTTCHIVNIYTTCSTHIILHRNNMPYTHTNNIHIIHKIAPASTLSCLKSTLLCSGSEHMFLFIEWEITFIQYVIHIHIQSHTQYSTYISCHTNSTQTTLYTHTHTHNIIRNLFTTCHSDNMPYTYTEHVISTTCHIHTIPH